MKEPNKKQSQAKAGAPLTLSKLDHLPEAPQPGDPDTLMGQQLAAQWDRVVSGQRDQLIFGAMMLKVREHLVSSARGQNSATRGPSAKGKGLDTWLKEYAPKVSKGTAYRLMEIAEGVTEEFKLGKKVDLEALLAGQVENLDEKLKAKRAKIEECIEGRSQRQLLLQFGRAEPAKTTGGKRETAKEQTAEERLAAWERAALEDFNGLAALLQTIGDRWKVPAISDAQREILADHLEELAAGIRTWVKTPKNRRTAAPLPEATAA